MHSTSPSTKQDEVLDASVKDREMYASTQTSCILPQVQRQDADVCLLPQYRTGCTQVIISFLLHAY